MKNGKQEALSFHLQIMYIRPVRLVKINPKVLHLPLHVLVLDADLHRLGMLVARILAHRFEYLAVQDRRSAGAAIFGEQARAVDVDPLRAAKFEERVSQPKGKRRPRVFLAGGGNPPPAFCSRGRVGECACCSAKLILRYIAFARSAICPRRSCASLSIVKSAPR